MTVLHPGLLWTLFMLFWTLGVSFRSICVQNRGLAPRGLLLCRRSSIKGVSRLSSIYEEDLSDQVLRLLREQSARLGTELTESELHKLRAARSMIDELLAKSNGLSDQKIGQSKDGPRDRRITYTAAGVDIEKGDRLVDIVKELSVETLRPGVMGSIGGFGALFNLTAANVPTQALLVASTDGVGTKVMLAREQADYETLGRDLVAMCVNDVLTMGAEPLFFLDYMGWPQLDLKNATSTLKGISDACRESGCALIGGETAELPGIYLPEGGRDLAGFVVGVVNPQDLLPRKQSIRAGDVVLGLRSNGVHSNGLSLIRRLIQDNPTLHYEAPAPFDTRVTLRQAIMRPTRIYIPALLPILKSQPGLIKAMAHITGGGLIGNLPRVLPTGLRVRIDWDAWTMPAIFSWLQGESGLSLEELAGVFNCGIGMCLVVAQQDCDALLEELKLLDEHHVVVVGQIVENTDSIDN